MVNDPDDREIAGIGLTASRLTCSRTAHTDAPVTGFGTDCIDSNFFGAAVEHNLEVLVFKIGNPIGGHEGLDDLDDEHDQ